MLQILSMKTQEGHGELLSSMDAAFLSLEEGGVYMHLGILLVFAGGPPGSDEVVDGDRILAYIRSMLPSLPRFRQRLAFAPFLKQPAWVDDAHFDPSHHLRRVRLQDDAALQTLCGDLY